MSSHKKNKLILGSKKKSVKSRVTPVKDTVDDDKGKQGMYEKTRITKFIKNITEKNYSEANKYLHAVLEDKLIARIRDTAKRVGF